MDLFDQMKFLAGKVSNDSVGAAASGTYGVRLAVHSPKDNLHAAALQVRNKERVLDNF